MSERWSERLQKPQRAVSGSMSGSAAQGWPPARRAAEASCSAALTEQLAHCDSSALRYSRHVAGESCLAARRKANLNERVGGQSWSGREDFLERRADEGDVAERLRDGGQCLEVSRACHPLVNARSLQRPRGVDERCFHSAIIHSK